MNNPFAHWQQQTLHLPQTLRLRQCEAIDWAQLRFPGNAVVVDASALTDIDSIGVAALVCLQRRATSAGVTLDWQHISAALTRMLAVYELDNGVFRSCKNN